MTWVRTGYCCQCGECCRGRDPFEGVMQPVVEGFCSLYRIVDGHGHCNDRAHPYYLGGCNVWPTQPSHVEDYPACTYRFVWVA
jgi:hypothetical protein